ncbi:hypothetical protein HBB16_11790 [Pseudonocardia sp. MCCB 268]|nr:hypothetical protein [Pseudonocardia cytotoxica]
MRGLNASATASPPRHRRALALRHGASAARHRDRSTGRGDVRPGRPGANSSSGTTSCGTPGRSRTWSTGP